MRPGVDAHELVQRVLRFVDRPLLFRSTKQMLDLLTDAWPGAESTDRLVFHQPVNFRPPSHDTPTILVCAGAHDRLSQSPAVEHPKQIQEELRVHGPHAIVDLFDKRVDRSYATSWQIPGVDQAGPGPPRNPITQPVRTQWRRTVAVL